VNGTGIVRQGGFDWQGRPTFNRRSRSGRTTRGRYLAALPNVGSKCVSRQSCYGNIVAMKRPAKHARQHKVLRAACARNFGMGLEL
jgi:hypothetical protein